MAHKSTLGRRRIIVSKAFTPKAPREWRMFQSMGEAIRKDWSMFTWTEEPDGSTRAEFRVASERDVAVVVNALAAFLSRFRNRRQLPKE
ncbi:hypothetical protein [Rhizobium sp. LjRoot258]|uniref:hypothetical protein n=1 Tax=Rhizobium sp. LjRoot258 TaxID=3342299 RepID=UPI003ED0EA52